MKKIHLNDKMTHKDTLTFGQSKPFARTRVQIGTNPYKDSRGITQLGELLYEEENMIVLGGVLFTLEKVFGVQSKLKVDYLNNIMGIATEGTPVDEIYPKDTVVSLFGIGTGGCGDVMTDVKEVQYYERAIKDMIPFRVVDKGSLSPEEEEMYWFRKDDEHGKSSYYLKKFATTPEIKVLWKDGEGDEDGSEVGDNVHETPSGTGTPIETFVEITLKISKKDIREYFENNGTIEQTRFNSIGLFTGIKSNVGDYEDYKQVKLFSKLNIPNEMLVLAKDITIIYRIYGS